MILSGVFIPLSSLPLGLRIVARALPLTYAVEALQSATAGMDMFVLAAFTALFRVSGYKWYSRYPAISAVYKHKEHLHKRHRNGKILVPAGKSQRQGSKNRKDNQHIARERVKRIRKGGNKSGYNRVNNQR